MREPESQKAATLSMSEARVNRHGSLHAKKWGRERTLPSPFFSPWYVQIRAILFFLQLHGLVVACRLDITLGSTALAVACFSHGKLHCTILTLADQNIAFLDFHTPTAFNSECRITVTKNLPWTSEESFSQTIGDDENASILTEI